MGSRIITICSWNCCSLTSASPPLTKVFVRTRCIWLLSIPLTVFTRRVLLDTVDVQKENCLLSVQSRFLERFGQNCKASLIKTRLSKESPAIFLLCKGKLKMYHQNKKEEQISFVLICKLSNKKQIWARQMAVQYSYIFLLVFFSTLVVLKAVGEESGSSENASGTNILSFTFKINK